MNRLYFIIVLLTAFIFCASCDDEEVFSDEEQARIDRELILEFIAENNLNAEEHESGLFYVIEEPGNILFPDSTSDVVVNYEGKLLDGNIFDSSYSRGAPLEFSLQGTIRGWQIGIPLFKKGGKGKLLIPSALGYGRLNQPGIPANSVLFFDRLELIEIN